MVCIYHVPPPLSCKFQRRGKAVAKCGFRLEVIHKGSYLRCWSSLIFIGTLSRGIPHSPSFLVPLPQILIYIGLPRFFLLVDDTNEYKDDVFANVFSFTRQCILFMLAVALTDIYKPAWN